MSVVWLRCRAELRAKWRNAVVLVLLIGIGGGIGATRLAGPAAPTRRYPSSSPIASPTMAASCSGAPQTPPVTAGFLPTRWPSPRWCKKSWNSRRWPPTSARPYLYLTSDRTGHKTGNISAIGVEDADMFRKVERPLVLAGHLPTRHTPFT